MTIQTLLNPPYSETMSVLEADIALDEGYREHPYRCTSGKLTIGYGYNLDAGMPQDEALVLMRYRLAKLYGRLAQRLPWFLDATLGRQRALCNMAYQLGFDGLMGFGRMLSACAAEEWDVAAEHALDSQWAKQTPARAQRIAAILRKG